MSGLVPFEPCPDGEVPGDLHEVGLLLYKRNVEALQPGPLVDLEGAELGVERVQGLVQPVLHRLGVAAGPDQ